MNPSFTSLHPPLPSVRNEYFRIDVMNRGINALDLEAVMSSRQSLRVWSDSSWPEDDFSLQQNLEDIDAHIADHEARTAYAYSILTADATVCIGSIYLKPIKVMNAFWLPSETLNEALKSYAARVDFWVRDSEVDRGFEPGLIQTIRSWGLANWKSELAFSLRPGMKTRLESYRASGLRELGTATSPTTKQTIAMFGKEAGL